MSFLSQPPGPYSELTTTSTGTQNDFSVGLLGTQNAFLRCNNASLLTINGITGGSAGQRLTILSVGAGQVDISHQAAGSTAANRMLNTATSGVTPLGAGNGYAEYMYDATTARWRLVTHEQGSWIVPTTPTFSGNGAMTWTSVSNNKNSFMLRGKTLHTQFDFAGTVGGTPSTLLTYTLPNGYTAASNQAGVYIGNLSVSAFWSATAGVNPFGFFCNLTAATNFTAGAWRVIGGALFEIT